MSFTGDLKHLPIVDVIQLLHATKKSGTLTVKGRHGECVFVFSEGYVVSGRHARKTFHLGQALVELRLTGEEVRDRVLQQQAKEGKPLAALFLEGGHVQKEGIVRGLEALIEMAIVEVLTWSGGTFTLEVDRVELLPDYLYFRQAQEELVFSTQNILMDALRIYDEKKRDGELNDEEEVAVETAATGGTPGGADSAPGASLSADDLGLADLDQLEEKIPGVFSCLPDINPLDLHRQKIQGVATELGPAEQEELLAFLQTVTERVVAAAAGDEELGRGRVILYSPDELFQYMLTVACKDTGVFIFATNDEQDLVPIIEQSLGKDNGTLLILDRPHPGSAGFAEENLVRLRRQLKDQYRRLPIVQLAPPADFPFAMRAFTEGIRTVFPRPTRADRPETFTADFILFLGSLRRHLHGFARAQGDKNISRLTGCLTAMRDAREAPEAALAALRYVAALFPRALTLVAGAKELVGDRAVGVDGREETRLALRIPLANGSLFARTVENGRLFYGPGEDPFLQEHLLKAIGPPQHPTCLVLPLASRGRTFALVYADFADREVAQVQTELLEILAAQAGLLLENLLLRKKLENPPR